MKKTVLIVALAVLGLCVAWLCVKEGFLDWLKNAVSPDDTIVGAAYDSDTVLSDQEKQIMASNDLSLLVSYIKAGRSGSLYQHYSGSYMSSENEIVLMLSCSNCRSCRKELRIIELNTTIHIKAGNGSYFEVMNNLEVINKKISEIYRNVQDGNSSEGEQSLMKFWPGAGYDDWNNQIIVKLVARDEETLKQGITLFKSVVGDYSQVIYKACSLEETQVENLGAG